jgi:hypothetical protein
MSKIIGYNYDIGCYIVDDGSAVSTIDLMAYEDDMYKQLQQHSKITALFDVISIATLTPQQLSRQILNGQLRGNL